MLKRNRGHLSFKALLDEVEVSPATLKREFDYLKYHLYAPIEFDRFLNGYRFGEGYRVQKHELPGLRFNAQAAGAEHALPSGGIARSWHRQHGCVTAPR
jgi:predicted DNA-binding transcriptional regulator YafY